MNINNIDTDPTEEQSKISSEQQAKHIVGLPTESVQTLNLPQVGQYQDGKQQEKQNNQLSKDQQQKHTDKAQTIQQQTSIKRDFGEMGKEVAAQAVQASALQKMQRSEEQEPKKQNVKDQQSAQKIEESNSNILQKSDTEVISQTQIKEYQSAKNEQSKQFFMSIKSEQSQVAILDQSSDNTLKNNEANRLESDFPHQLQSVKIFNAKNRECKSQNHSGKSSSEENQNTTVIKYKEQLNQLEKTNQNNPIVLEKITENEKKQSQEKIRQYNVFTASRTQQLILQNKEDPVSIKTAQESAMLSNQRPSKQKKLNFISCNFSLGIDKQNILYEKEQKVMNTNEKKQGQKEKVQTKVQPLDLKTLSVLTLSSPQGIKSIRPPSPKLSGERKAKPWEKLKKAKPTETIQPKESILATDMASTQSMISRTTSSIIQNTSKIEQTSKQLIQKTEGENMKSQIVKQTQMQNKVQPVQLSVQQLKKNYSYITSVIQPTRINEITMKKASQSMVIDNNKILAEQQTKLVKEQQKMLKSTQQIKIQSTKIAEPLQKQSTETLVHQQAKNHPLLRHYPIHYKTIQKQQALAEEPPQTILQHENIQFGSKEKQLQLINKDEGKISESEMLILNEKLSEKKSTGSEIINDSSFQAKKSQKSGEIKKRLYQLEMQIQQQKKINQQLQVSSTFERKLLLSLLAGLTAGSLSFFMRKDKLGSVLLALATGVSTFIIKK